ncbi:MAG TPA: DNA-binding protein [Actinobacteria bacterium]|nr:DNA-binding protein [Actinomycetota bacterium]
MIGRRLEVAAVHLVRLATGDDLYEGLTTFVTDAGITAATVTCLGAVRRASLRYYDQDLHRYDDFVLDEHLELVAGVGNVSLLEGASFLHLHAAFARADGQAFGGHVNVGTEVFALEAHVTELRGEPPRRRPDDCTGLTLWG